MSDKIVWQSTLTESMVARLNSEELELMISDLDDAVAGICEEFDIK